MTSVATTPTAAPIDREKTCPLLLRVFVNEGQHHLPDAYHRGRVPATELQIYTWKDACLKELTNLIKDVHPQASSKGTMFNFALVFPDKRGNYHFKEVGTTSVAHNGPDDRVTLSAVRLEIGDYMDVAIRSPPEERGPPRDRRAPLRRSGEGRGFRSRPY
ncbi:hypothetical protein ACHWQZ_G003198 [Mnemiopsis leidyi]